MGKNKNEIKNYKNNEGKRSKKLKIYRQHPK